MTNKEILEDWEWLNKNLLGTLFNFDHEDQITEFVRCKIESLVAHSQPSTPVIEGILILSIIHLKNITYYTYILSFCENLFVNLCVKFRLGNSSIPSIIR